MINKKITYFLTLAECLSFTQAAAVHNVSQTAISQYIAGLEERVGVKLFARSPHQVKLTEAGKYYYEQVCRIRKIYDDTLQQLETIDSGFHGYLKVGIGVYEYCSTENFFSEFLSQHPEIKVDIFQYPYSELSEKLRTGELDVIIGLAECEEAFARSEIGTQMLFTSANVLTASQTVASRYPAPNAKEMLAGECLITNCEDSGPSSLQMLHKLLKDEVGFIPDRIEQTNSVNTQLMMVRAGHGVAIVPGFVADAQGADLVKLPMPSGESKKYRYELICLKGNANPAVKTLFGFQQGK